MERPARPGLSVSLAIMANIVATKDIQLPKTSDKVPNHLVTNISSFFYKD